MDTSVVVVEAVATDAVRRRNGPRQLRSTEEKRRIVEEIFKPGVSVARVAQAHGVNANLVFGWRKLYQKGLLERFRARITRAQNLIGRGFDTGAHFFEGSKASWINLDLHDWICTLGRLKISVSLNKAIRGRLHSQRTRIRGCVRMSGRLLAPKWVACRRPYVD